MLVEIDRVQIATHDAAGASERWISLLGAVEVGRDVVASLRARRTILRAGASDVELLEPDGAGVVDTELKRRGRAHLFAAGAASPDPEKVAEHAEGQGAQRGREGDQHFLRFELEGAPLHFVVSPPKKRERAGDLDFLYEATVLAADQSAAVNRIAAIFALDKSEFTTITSELFGYTGVLTLFRAGQLHRFEVITPTDMQKTMGRFYAREGASFYMAFAESARMLAIEGRARTQGAGITVDRPEGRAVAQTADQFWLHPPGLGGMMLGVSRPSMAWRWSGHPERVVAIE